jgi:NAD(P)-dependent dehydrogenase (short-subunit alcohol dehydrogenase family)
MSHSFVSERVALVTGGASGIGRALVQRLAAEHRVVVVDKNETAAKEAAAAVHGIAVALDLTDPTASAQAVGAAVTAYGRLDVVCLNAGRTTGEYQVEKIDADRYRAVVALNQDAVFFGVAAAVPALRASGGGTIIATASLGGLVGQPEDPVYSMTKHAVVALVRSLPKLLEPDGIRIHAVCPGYVDTPLLSDHVQLLRDAGFPLLQPDDVAAAAMTAMASDSSGEVWVVQPGREPLPYKFRGVPGPRVEGQDGVAPPGLF